MTVGNLLDILNGYSRDDEIELMNQSSRKLEIMGINLTESAATGKVVIDTKWVGAPERILINPEQDRKEKAKKKAKVETEDDRLKELARIAREYEKVRPKRKYTKRTDEERAAVGYVKKTGKRGRPRKYILANDLANEGEKPQ